MAKTSFWVSNGRCADTSSHKWGWHWKFEVFWMSTYLYLRPSSATSSLVCFFFWHIQVSISLWGGWTLQPNHMQDGHTEAVANQSNAAEISVIYPTHLWWMALLLRNLVFWVFKFKASHVFQTSQRVVFQRWGGVSWISCSAARERNSFSWDNCWNYIVSRYCPTLQFLVSAKWRSEDHPAFSQRVVICRSLSRLDESQRMKANHAKVFAFVWPLLWFIKRYPM